VSSLCRVFSYQQKKGKIYLPGVFLAPFEGLAIFFETA
jgi:hypothetical protein